MARKTKAEIAANRRIFMQETFEKAHSFGAERHGGLWLSANSSAVEVMREFGWDVTSLENKAMVSAVVLKVLDRAKRHFTEDLK